MKLLFYIACTFIISACAASISPPVLPTASNVQLDTLSSAVSLSVRSPEQTMSASGILLYKYPDKVHVIILSPFGTTLFEAYAVGDSVAFVYPTERVAFVGTINELPDKGGLNGWGSIYWVLSDAFVPHGKQMPLNGISEVIRSDGIRDRISVENGYVTSKEATDGKSVYYGRYSAVNGIQLAHELDIRNKNDEQLRIILEEPEINVPIEATSFVPRITDLKIYPLRALNK